MGSPATPPLHYPRLPSPPPPIITALQGSFSLMYRGVVGELEVRAGVEEFSA